MQVIQARATATQEAGYESAEEEMDSVPASGAPRASSSSSGAAAGPTSAPMGDLEMGTMKA